MASYTAPSTRPQSLDAALARIAHLERQLALAEQLVRDRAGLDLHELLAEAEQGRAADSGKDVAASQAPSNGATPPPPPSSSLASHSDTLANSADGADPASDTPAEPIDVGPYVLRALALRKRVHLGEVTDAQAEEELRVLFEGEAAALSEDQRATVRQWAGL
ncbi:hypothetical protein JCM10450v2_003125 [Rhodotorula kratochvilovae]